MRVSGILGGNSGTAYPLSMSTKFFNNQDGNTLFAKFKGIADGMGEDFHTFQAVAGIFRYHCRQPWMKG